MDLGAFSVSLSVKDIEASMSFYAKLGFEQVGGNPKENWVILRNGEHAIGLFQGMFKDNILTFNPGWDQKGNELDSFTDVREILHKLKSHGMAPDTEIDSDSGPASVMLSDPDGNQILIDQHR